MWLRVKKVSKRFFITGTDTDVGKTYFACQWLNALKKQQIKTVALKPIASGCIRTAFGLHNDDALQLQKAASIALPYATVNPFAFEPAIAPHIAAKRVDQNLNADKISSACASAFNYPADLYLIEGAGGWSVPLNENETWEHFVKAIEAQVILVVAIRLGCLNHALLSIAAIESSGCPLFGWVANCLDPDMPDIDENIAFLHAHIHAPLLSVMKKSSAFLFSTR